MYDAAIARWHVPDPLAEYHYNMTPYNYCLNNPINYIDPFGLDTMQVDPKSGLPSQEIDPVYVYGNAPKKTEENGTGGWEPRGAPSGLTREEREMIKKIGENGGEYATYGEDERGRVTVARGMSGDVVLALGPAGFAYETGYFVYNGKTFEFMSVGYANGLEGSIGLNYFAIRDKQGSFVPMDYAGTSATDNFSMPYYTYGRESATVNSDDPYRTGYKANSHGVGASVLPLGYSHINGYTWVREYKKKVVYSPLQLTHGR